MSGAFGSAAPVTCLLFDFGGTLDADGVAWKERFHDLYRAEGLQVSDAVFDRAFYDADDPLVGGLDVEADLGETVRRLVDNLEAGLAAVQHEDPARARRVATRFLEESQATLQRNLGTLQALSGRYRLGVVSNFYGNLDAVCRGLGIADLFGVVVDSERAGAVKPDPAIFRTALDALGASPDGAVMIGDSLRRDGEGARLSGLGFIWMAPGPAAAGADAPASVDKLTALRELLL